MRVRNASLAVIAAMVLGLAPSFAGPAAADGEVRTTGTTMSVLPTSNDPADETWTLSVRLTSQSGEEISGAPVRFFMMAPIFGGRLMDLGDVPTDATGIASLVYRPTWLGSHTAVFRFDGDETREPAETTLQFESDIPIHAHEPADFGIEPIRRWMPFVAIAAVLVVWGSLGYVITSTVVGIRSGVDRAPWEQQKLRRIVVPVVIPKGSLLRALLFVVALGLLAAVPIALLLRAPDGVELAAFPVDDSAVVRPAPGGDLSAVLVRAVQTRIGGPDDRSRANSADLPADVAVIRNRLFILDTNNGRLMAVTPDGALTPILESTALGEVFFKGAMAMDSHGGRLYVANAAGGNILVVTPEGHLERVIELQVPEGEDPIFPAGIVITPSGEIWLSDSANHRVFLLNQRGEYIGVIGEGAPTYKAEGFSTPGGLALDEYGNLFVADTDNQEVKKYSPLGVFLSTFGKDVLIHPNAVAVDNQGRILVSDTELMSVVAFAPDGSFLGCVGSGTCADQDPENLFQAPYGLKVYDDSLYVMDRLAGVFVFHIGPTGTSQ